MSQLIIKLTPKINGDAKYSQSVTFDWTYADSITPALPPLASNNEFINLYAAQDILRVDDP